MNKKKLLQQMLNSKKNVKFKNFALLAEAFGFEHVRTEGSHHIYKHSQISKLLNIQSVKGEAKPYQIREFFVMIEKNNLEMED